MNNAVLFSRTLTAKVSFGPFSSSNNLVTITVEKIFQVTNEIAHNYVIFVTLSITVLDKFILDMLHKI